MNGAGIGGPAVEDRLRHRARQRPAPPLVRGLSLHAGVVIAAVRRRLDDELVRRFAARPAYPTALLDAALRGIIVPFNERTASRTAIALPRGSHVAVPSGKLARMFVHWCEPERDGTTTDVDLSVAFYDAAWQYLGVCSYHELRWQDIATSSGDLRAAPFPAGASEFVDVDRARARAQGVRFAVMVVNNYSGMAFAQLERGFAGLMLRDGARGEHFDPRTVALRFDLAGANGVFVPLVFDLERGAISASVIAERKIAAGGTASIHASTAR